MASSTAPLGPQNQNQKEHTGFLKHQERNTFSEQLKAKPHTAQASKRGSENRDPSEAAKPAKGVNKLKNVSRLPVLAKSLQPVLTDISQSLGHKRWEERPLLGKAQKRKTCTKPVPFSLSQSRTRSQKIAEAGSEKERSRMPSTRQTPSKTLTTSQQRMKNRTQNAKHVDHTNNTKTIPLSLHGQTKSNPAKSQVDDDSSNETGFSIQRDLSRQLGSITLAHSEPIKDQSHSFRTAGVEDQTVYQPKAKSCIQILLSANCTNVTGSTVAFSPEPSALHSILRNEGIKVSGPVGATPQASACPSGRGTSIYSARRVPVKKPQTEAATAQPGATGSAVPFSPDASALRSILQKEGVRVADPSGATPRMSTCPSGRKTSIYSAQRVPVKKPQTEAATAQPGATGSAVPFSPDASALRNILQKDGVNVGDASGAMPRMSTCPSGRKTSIYSAQRVPVKKPQTEAATAVLGRTGSAVPFSPDPSALRSILLNEGIKAGVPVGMTPRVSTCPSGRGTSIYTAQRVPVKKARAEAAYSGVSRTPNMKWTPQRVPCSQSQSLRKLICAPKTPLFSASPGFCKAPADNTGSSTQQEEDVVQRLFQEEPEQEGNEQMEEGGDTGPLWEHHQTVESHLKLEGSTSTNHCHSEKENNIPEAQPFIQAPHRQSVIVLSSGQRLFGPGPTHDDAQTPLVGIPEHAEQRQPCATSTEVQSTAPAPSVQSSESQSALKSDSKQITPSAQCKTKASGLSSAVCALRRRLPPLEELILDEECAMFTSSQQAWPAQPRCSNPVASTLLFQDSTCFVPIGLNSPSLSPVSHLPSPIRA